MHIFLFTWAYAQESGNKWAMRTRKRVSMCNSLRVMVDLYFHARTNNQRIRCASVCVLHEYI